LQSWRSQLLIGWREWVSLPDLDVPGIKAKIDTGARTSALHAYQVAFFDRDGVTWVRFQVHPVQRRRRPVLHCEAPLVDRRVVTSSNGAREERPVIRTRMRLGPVERRIELTLSNRDDMGFRMLVGREALRGRFLVDARHSYTAGEYLDSDFYQPPGKRRERPGPAA
jgi:hypothetical protein